MSERSLLLTVILLALLVLATLFASTIDHAITHDVAQIIARVQDLNTTPTNH